MARSSFGLATKKSGMIHGTRLSGAPSHKVVLYMLKGGKIGL